MHSVYCAIFSLTFIKSVCVCVCVCVIFPFGFESGMWDLVVLIPDHCLPIYFSLKRVEVTDCTCVASILILPMHMD